MNPIKVACFIKRKLEHLFNPNFSKELPRFFDEFQKRNLHFSDRVYHSYAELKAAPPQADCYIVGSDQVWNMHWFGEKLEDYQKALHAYFLDFGNPQIKRMSYAASWSCDSLPENVYQEIQPLLAKFNYVSVREFSGIQMCEKCGCKNAEHVLDPTMLLDAESYRSLYRQVENSKVVEKKFLLLYLLGTSCDLDINKVYRFAKTHHLEVVYVSGNGKSDKYSKTFATIEQWLWLVDNAEYVITNSYHCSVFSLLFKKHFAVAPIIGKFASMNSRIENLFNQWNCGNRFIKQNNFAILDIDYNANLKVPQNSFLKAISN